jgi:hypothetical protein
MYVLPITAASYPAHSGCEPRQPARACDGAVPAISLLIMRARAFSVSLEPFTPLLHNARCDTGFPAAASLRPALRA